MIDMVCITYLFATPIFQEYFVCCLFIYLVQMHSLQGFVKDLSKMVMSKYEWINKLSNFNEASLRSTPKALLCSEIAAQIGF